MFLFYSDNFLVKTLEFLTMTKYELYDVYFDILSIP